MKYDRLRDLRDDKDWTQSVVAEKLYINRRTYSSYETGIRSIPPETLIKLSEIYGTSVDYILGLIDVRKPYPKSKTFSP
ncbi:helix-turn-helix domain-containing protein [Oscillospiraceae bacterium OttesenSCG-928-F05]|nr:helix-turn-helix domain-containing protein [Oscillospiraceae bacterium OttesenSCG-928-F05]